MHLDAHAAEMDDMLKESERLKTIERRSKSGKTTIKDLQQKLDALRAELENVNQARIDDQTYFKEQIRAVEETAAKRVF